MKKLFLLLLVPFIVACSSDDEDFKVINPDIIAGSWYELYESSSDSIVFTFENSRCVKKDYERYTSKLKNEVDFGTYSIKEVKWHDGYEEFIGYTISFSKLPESSYGILQLPNSINNDKLAIELRPTIHVFVLSRIK